MSNTTTNSQTEKLMLLEERVKLRKKLAAIEADYRKGLAPDSEERAIELENADVLEGIAKATAEELDRVEERLSMLE